MKKRFFGIKNIALAVAIIVSALTLYVTPMKTYAYKSNTMPSGYRPITSQDVGKTFGVDLETTIYFTTNAYVDPIKLFDIARLTDDLGREYYISSFDYGEAKPYTYGYAVYDEWQESPLRHYYKELYTFDAVGGMGYWDVSVDANPNYIVPNGYKLDLYYRPPVSNYNIIWVKDKGGGDIIYALPLVDIEDGRYSANNKVPTLPEPTYENRYFVGWYFDAQYKIRAYSGEDILQSEVKNDGVKDFIILYGRWDADATSEWEDQYRAIWTQEGYDDGFIIGQGIGEQKGYARAMDEFGSQEGGLYWLKNIATAVGGLLALEVFPSISIGLLVFIPMAFGLLFWFLKLLKGGGD